MVGFILGRSEGKEVSLGENKELQIKDVMKKEFTTSEKLQHSTIRIVGWDIEGNGITGTGFFFNFTEIPNGFVNNTPVIVTNRHVVETMEKGSLIFTLADSEHNPIDTEHYNLILNSFKDWWIYHPDSDIDLCVLPLLNAFMNLPGNIVPYYVCLDKSLLPTKSQLDALDAIEDIIMVGYPSGIWDEVNNQPIIRRGVTATHPNKDYQGRKEFLADVAAFPGSSGSPVFIMNSGAYANSRDQSFVIGSRLFFMGVLYAGPTMTSQGDIKIKTIPTNTIAFSEHRLQMNLGMIIKSEMILDLERVYAEQVRIQLEKLKQ